MRIFRKWVLAIALFVSIVLDGSLSFYLHQFLTFKGAASSCDLLLIGIMLIALFDDINQNEFWLALGTGVVADIVNLGFIGVYTVFLPVACWVCQKMARFLPEVFWSRLIIVLLGTIVFEIYSWAILNLVGIISAGTRSLLVSSAYNLIWTLVFFILTYWIWGRLATDYPFLIDLNAYRQ